MATDWQAEIGYSPVKVGGSLAFVSGTGPLEEDGRVAAGDAFAQARVCLDRIEERLASVGAGLDDVVQTRILLAAETDWQAVGRAHGEVFGDVRPASTMLRAQLMDPDFLVEIEAVATLPGAAS